MARRARSATASTGSTTTPSSRRASTDRSRPAATPRSPIWRQLAVVGALVFVAATVLAVPFRGYLAQRTEVSSRQAELAELREQNTELVERSDRLDDPEEIQRIARRDYGLVAEGEESYTILPPATAGLVLPRAWPFDRLSGPLERAATAPS
jgi:cell division protein FtsB